MPCADPQLVLGNILDDVWQQAQHRPQLLQGREVLTVLTRQDTAHPLGVAENQLVVALPQRLDGDAGAPQKYLS